MTNQGTHDQRSNVYHSYPWGSAYCGNISAQPGGQYLAVSGYAPNHSADQMNFEQHQVYPVVPSIPTIDPRFIHPSGMMQPYQQVVPYQQIVPYGQPTALTNPFMYEASTVVQPYQFQNYQQAISQQAQMYNRTYCQAPPSMHFNIPTCKLERNQGNLGVAEENAAGGNTAQPEPLQPTPERSSQELPQERAEVLWKPPFYEPNRVPGCIPTSSSFIEDDDDSFPLSTNTSDLSTLREVGTIETTEPPTNTKMKLSQLKKEIREKENNYDRENEDEQVSQDAISFSSDEIISGALMCKKGSCDDHEVLCESSSENSRAVEYSSPRDITSEGRSAIALEPAPLVYSIDAKVPKLSRNRKSFGLDEVSCSQASAASLSPRSLSLSTVWQNDSVDFPSVYSPEDKVPMLLSPHRLLQEFTAPIVFGGNDSRAGTPAPPVNEPCSVNKAVNLDINLNISLPKFKAPDHSEMVPLIINKGRMLERESAQSVKAVNSPERTLPAIDVSFSPAPQVSASPATTAPSGVFSTLSDAGTREVKPLPLILETAVVEAPWQKVGGRKNHRQQASKARTPLPKPAEPESPGAQKQESQPPVKTSRKSRKKRRRKKNKKGAPKKLSASTGQSRPIPTQEMHNQPRKSVCSSLKEHLLSTLFINLSWKEKTN